MEVSLATQKNRAKVRAWRLAFPEKARNTRNIWKNKLRICIANAKAAGCAKCGERHPACLDFHHIDPATKEFNIGLALGAYSLKRLKIEIAKCIVLCANCHRKFHAFEREQEIQ